MKTKFNSSNYGNDLRITSKDAAMCSHSGQCDDDVARLLLKPYIAKQIALLDKEQLRKELHEYGAWTDTELENHEENILRWVWISCGDIHENK